jgi:hypothetical protein
LLSAGSLLLMKFFLSFHLFATFISLFLTNFFVEVLRNFDFSYVHGTVLLGEFLDSLQVVSYFSGLFDDSIICLRTVASSDTSLLAAATRNLIL